jgi:hypothetical protein
MNPIKLSGFRGIQTKLYPNQRLIPGPCLIKSASQLLN